MADPMKIRAIAKDGGADVRVLIFVWKDDAFVGIVRI